MGQTNAKVDGRGIRFYGETYSNYLGQVKLYKSDRDKLTAGVRNNKFNIDLLQHASLKHYNFLNLLTYSSESAELLGMNQENVCLYFDHVDISLEDIINTRRKRSQYFQMDEIMRFLKDILSALSYLEETQTNAHYAISPQSIFYDKQSRCMVIYDNECIFGQFSSYFNIKNGNYGLVAPEMIPALILMKKNNHDPYYTIDQKESQRLLGCRNKTDIYCLGLSLLQVCTYINSDDLFDYQQMQFNEQELEQRVRLAVHLQGKSAFLNQLLRLMLEKDVNKRPFASKLLQRIKYYERNPQLYFTQQAKNKPKIQQELQQERKQLPKQKSQAFLVSQQRSVSPMMKSSAIISSTRLPAKTIHTQITPTRTTNRFTVPQKSPLRSTVRPQRSISPMISNPVRGISPMIMSPISGIQ